MCVLNWISHILVERSLRSLSLLCNNVVQVPNGMVHFIWLCWGEFPQWQHSHTRLKKKHYCTEAQLFGHNMMNDTKQWWWCRIITQTISSHVKIQGGATLEYCKFLNVENWFWSKLWKGEKCFLFDTTVWTQN